MGFAAAAHATPTNDYLAARDGYIRALAISPGPNAAAPVRAKAASSPTRDLQRRLQRIVGAVDVPGFAQQGALNVWLAPGEPGTDNLDALAYPPTGRKAGHDHGVLLVTTTELARDWVAARRAADDGEGYRLPADMNAALASDAFYTLAAWDDRHVTARAVLPVRARPGSYAFAMLALRPSDVDLDPPNEIDMALVHGDRIDVMTGQLPGFPVQPIPACEAGPGHAPADAGSSRNNAPDADALSDEAAARSRSCYAKLLPRQTYFQVAVTRAQALIDRLNTH